MADCCRIPTREQSTDTGSLQEPTIVSDFATSGVIYGGTDGCNYRSGNVVVGIEYDMS